VQFASDFLWVAGQGVHVERYNLAQQPQAYAAKEIVRAALEKYGNACLPLILLDGAIVSQGRYPTREELARLVGLELDEPPSIYADAVAELVAIGASIAANCEPCFKYHFDRARRLGVSREDMMRAVKTAQAVKDTPARAVLELADRYLGQGPRTPGLPVIQSSCCG
jgi:AhpD family alkylhydroperoxidase